VGNKRRGGFGSNERLGDDGMMQAPGRRSTQSRFPGTRAVVALMLREMGTTYGRSPGGYAWAIIEPVAAVALLTIVFSISFRSPPLGNEFALFYATGYLPFVMYSDITMKIGQSIRYSKPLLTYPRVTYMDALLSRFVLNALTHAMVFLIVMAGIIVLDDLNLVLRYGAIAQAFGMALAVALGVGTLNCYLSSTFPVWERIWGIANRPLFIISGVFFLLESVPEPFRSLLLFNPLTHVISQMRAGFYSTYDARYVSPLFVYGLSGLCLFIGLVLLNRYHRDILNEGG
jgi:capsular polysaccharide transport system permease protein